MKKKTAVSLFLCFVCLAVIGIVAMAGISKWQSYQAELAQQDRQAVLDSYADELESSFDALYAAENGLLDDMAKRRAAGETNRAILLDSIQAIGDPIDALAAVEAPEEFAEAQRHFVTAAEAYHSMADSLTGMLSDETEDHETIKNSLIAMLPDAVDAFDQVRYGIEFLQESALIELPESAVLLEESLDYLMNDGISSMLTTEDK